MAAVTTQSIKALREKTGAGVMEAKRALEQADGSVDQAEQLLREWGLARASKKAGREAAQGLVEAYIHAGRIGALVEVNCETDFVARTDEFRRLAHDIAMQVAATNPSAISAEDGGAQNGEQPLMDQPFIRDNALTVRDLIQQAIAKLGENIVIRRYSRFELGGE